MENVAIDPAIPKDMTLNEKMHLVDAGLYLNSPYPSVLGKARDIDLIISFDFSEGDPFEVKAPRHMLFLQLNQIHS